MKYRIPICPYCSYRFIYDDWHVAVSDGNITGPVECPSCKKLFKVEATVQWTSIPIKDNAQPLIKFEVFAKHSVVYVATVEVANYGEAINLASGHLTVDDKFWKEVPYSWNFDIEDAVELKNE